MRHPRERGKIHLECIYMQALMDEGGYQGRYEKAFHDVVLLGGAVPMEVLNQKVADWIESQK